MTVTIEILKEEALALLRNLEQLKLLQFVPTKRKVEKEAANPNPLQDNTPPTPDLEAEAIRPMRKDISVDEILASQNFKGFDRPEMDRLIQEIDVKEPIEELLAMLKA